MGEKMSRRELLKIAASTVPIFTPEESALFTFLSNHSSRSVADNPVERFSLIDPRGVQIQGLLGDRCLKNIRNRILPANEDELHQGFQTRGDAPEERQLSGSWLRAASLAYNHTRDEALRSKLERVVSAFLAAQKELDGPDAQTKNPAQTVMVHASNLLGLVSYHTATTDKAALDASVRIANHLVNNFGRQEDGSTKLDLNDFGSLNTSVSAGMLEPIVLLHRITGEVRYLAFAGYIIEKWEEERGPRIISKLNSTRSVKSLTDIDANAVISALTGLCELYRTTKEQRYITPVVYAWNDIASNQLLNIDRPENQTRARQVSSDRKFDLTETCVSAGWIMLSRQLLQLTGESRYADELEKTYYNHLAASQRYDGKAWACHAPLEGSKSFKIEDGCCSNAGTQAWAMLPAFVYMTSPDGIVINFFAQGTAAIKLNDETIVVKQETSYPNDGRVKITVTVPKPMKFSLFVRVPAWSGTNGLKSNAGNYWQLRQTWSRTQTIEIDLDIPVRLIPGTGNDAGKLALVRGPQIMAVEELYNPGLVPLTAAALTLDQPVLKNSLTYMDAEGGAIYETEAVCTVDTEKFKPGDSFTLRLVPFSTAGSYNHHYNVWVKRAGDSSN